MSITPGSDGDASDFIDESERDSTPANDAGRVPKLESDGRLHGAFLPNEFGDGSDGDVTISTPTTLTRDMYYDNLTVTSTLTTDGYKIFVKDTIDGTGTIDWGTPNNGAKPTTPTTSTVEDGGIGGAGSGSGALKSTPGQDGALGVTFPSSVGGSAVAVTQNPCIGGASVAGGAGGAGQNDAGGTSTGGAVVLPRPVGVLAVDAVAMLTADSDGLLVVPIPQGQAAGGAGGGGDDSSSGTYRVSGSGGGGGASGGIVHIVAKTWAGSFTIKALGGTGGDGGDAGRDGDANMGGGGAGGGGNGGVSVVVYQSKTWTGSYTLTGGTGGAAGSAVGSGIDGGAGNTGNTGNTYEIEYSSLL